MGRRPKGLLTTVREAVRTWWHSKFDDIPAEEPDPTGSDADGSAPAARKDVFVQSLPQETALAMAARDDVFSFQVFPTFQWSSQAMSRETLKTRVQQYEGTAREELLRVAWSAARACDPADPAAAETAVNAVLSTAGNWCFDDENGLIRCTPTVRVRVDPALREHVLPHHLDELTLKETQRLGLIRAERALTLTEAWLKVISELELLGELDAHQRRLLVPFAATFADQEFRKVMEALRGHRRTSIDALVTALHAARGDHQEAGLFEFADAYDKALSAFCREVGVGPFSWVENAVAADGRNQ
ncbi:hypothetical protein [Streptomyces sp. NBC_01294]|uniref:hypothetical protein n=1 Tax=Streptomyces sp. NBC_01294 TaxID=2903815 RepID=UPI002DD7DDDB|nr:hypothetical protein [Streptomyces sp. NBC_01294]WRZ61010.1 hypothetical protein OG534_33660 [Streptomyces sp. NBC_01294]